MMVKTIYCALFYLPVLSLDMSMVIKTTGGLVRGKTNQFNGLEYRSYQGIPYAENPTGELRFKPPVPRKPWTDVFDATKNGPVCLQPTFRYYMKDTVEDCLTVNVYVPARKIPKLLPVMVFVHGGALQYLSGNIKDGHGPQLLLQQDIIFVTMNYRLVPFGFLSLGIEEASGNTGLKDVILSLKWVKENIINFGGSPDNITIAGLSSGSLIINYLMLSNHSDGLFNQAMLFSGSAFAPRSFAKHPTDIALALADELGIKSHNVYNVLENLQKIDAYEILDAYRRMAKNHGSPLRRYCPFMPSKEVKSNHALFVDDPIEEFRKYKNIAQKIPVVVGITTHEAISTISYVLTNIDGTKKLRKNHEDLIPSNIEYPIGSQKSKDLARIICETYFGGEDMSNFTLTKLIDFMSDTQFIYGVHYWINKYKNMTNSGALHFYIFNFIGDLSMTVSKSKIIGTSHGDDASYFLTRSLNPIIEHSDERRKEMMKTMISLVSNFIYKGNPTPDVLINKMEWPDYGKDQNYLLLNENPTVEKFNNNVLYERMLFWEKVYDEYYDYLDNGGETQKKIIP